MNPDKFAFAVAVAVFAAGALGLLLRGILPEKHVTGGAKDMIGAVVGLLTLLSALVLGLLIWTAHGVYSAQNVAIQTLAAKALDFDLALAEYGPEANAARAQFRERLAKTIDQVWGASESDSNFAANNFAAAIQSERNWDATLAGLHPSTDAQKQALAAAKSAVESIEQSRLQMSFALTSPVSIPLVLIVSGMGDASLFRLRSDIRRSQRRGFPRHGPRRRRGGERSLADPRVEQPILRHLSRFGRAARTSAGGHGQSVRRIGNGRSNRGQSGRLSPR